MKNFKKYDSFSEINEDFLSSLAFTQDFHLWELIGLLCTRWRERQKISRDLLGQI